MALACCTCVNIFESDMCEHVKFRQAGKTCWAPLAADGFADDWPMGGDVCTAVVGQQQGRTTASSVNTECNKVTGM